MKTDAQEGMTPEAKRAATAKLREQLEEVQRERDEWKKCAEAIRDKIITSAQLAHQQPLTPYERASIAEFAYGQQPSAPTSEEYAAAGRLTNPSAPTPDVEQLARDLADWMNPTNDLSWDARFDFAMRYLTQARAPLVAQVADARRL
jgi:hypothetical protein